MLGAVVVASSVSVLLVSAIVAETTTFSGTDSENPLTVATRSTE